MGLKITAELADDTLKMAISRRHPKEGCAHHTDHASQYASLLLGKTKRACQDICKREEATLEIFEYIECFYNRLRLHADRGSMSPDKYKKKYWPQPLAA